jgi:hypothetical protein
MVVPLAPLISHKTRTSIVQLESELPTKASVGSIPFESPTTRRESGLWLRRPAACGYGGTNFRTPFRQLSRGLVGGLFAASA